MALEQEIKMVVNSEQRLDISLFDTVRPLQIRDKKVSYLRNTYFDTPDLLLSQQKLGLRIRKCNDSWLQTVKT
ncbi:MAG: CYTH domain-containing protein, partial [Bacteroidales bacterium]|nr:CYTH domain-containing protein [Bacteroidales bacterium]